MHMLGALPQQALPGAAEPMRPVLATAEDVALVMPADADPKLLEGFFHEAPEQARYLVELARNMVSGQGDSSDLVAARRVAHTLKGSGAIIGLRGLASLGHHFEDILEHFEREGGRVAKPAADALLDAAYCLEQMVGHVAGSDEYPAQAQSVLQDVLDLANRIDRGESLESPLTRAAGAATARRAAGRAAAPGGAFPGGRPRGGASHQRGAGRRIVPALGRGVRAQRRDGVAHQGPRRPLARAAGAEPARAKAPVRAGDAGRRACPHDDARPHPARRRPGVRPARDGPVQRAAQHRPCVDRGSRRRPRNGAAAGRGDRPARGGAGTPRAPGQGPAAPGDRHPHDGRRCAGVAAAAQRAHHLPGHRQAGRAGDHRRRDADRRRRAQPAGRPAAAPPAQRRRPRPGAAARAQRGRQGRSGPDRTGFHPPGAAGGHALHRRRPGPGSRGDPRAGRAARVGGARRGAGRG